MQSGGGIDPSIAEDNGSAADDGKGGATLGRAKSMRRQSLNSRAGR